MNDIEQLRKLCKYIMNKQRSKHHDCITVTLKYFNRKPTIRYVPTTDTRVIRKEIFKTLENAGIIFNHIIVDEEHPRGEDSGYIIVHDFDVIGITDKFEELRGEFNYEF